MRDHQHQAQYVALTCGKGASLDDLRALLLVVDLHDKAGMWVFSQARREMQSDDISGIDRTGKIYRQ